jgi:hypothetical protein
MRLMMARACGSRNDRAHLDEAEPHGGQRVDVAAVLVQAGRQPDGIGKREPHAVHRPSRQRTRCAEQPEPGRGIEGGQAEVVGSLSVQPEQHRPQQGVDAMHGRQVLSAR